MSVSGICLHIHFARSHSQTMPAQSATTTKAKESTRAPNSWHCPCALPESYHNITHRNFQHEHIFHWLPEANANWLPAIFRLAKHFYWHRRSDFSVAEQKKTLIYIPSGHHRTSNSFPFRLPSPFPLVPEYQWSERRRKKVNKNRFIIFA